MQHGNRTMLLVFAACVALACAIPAVALTTWDLATEFSIANGNPNGPWTYGCVKPDATQWDHDFVSATSIWGGLVGWYGSPDNTGNKIPFVGVATTPNPDGTWDWPQGKIGQHADNTGHDWGSGFKWTSPANVLVDLTGGCWMPRNNAQSRISLVLDGRILINKVLVPRSTDLGRPTTSSNPFTLVDGVKASGGDISNLNGIHLLPGQTIVFVVHPDTAHDYFVYDFTITEIPTAPAPTPVISPAAGTLHYSTYVTMSCKDWNAVVRYTTDGTEPTSSSTLYTAPIFISSATTFKAKAFSPGLPDSATATAAYTFASPGSGWSLVGDWQDEVLPSREIGPDRAWSYGYDTSASTLPITFQAWQEWGQSWGANPGYRDAAFFVPNDGFGPGIALAVPPGEFYPANTVNMHTAPGDRMLLLRWVAPSSLTVSMTGSAQSTQDYGVLDPPQDPRPHEVGIRKNNEITPLWSAVSNDPTEPGSFSFPTMDVNRGDTFYFYFKPLETQGMVGCTGWTISALSGERVATPVLTPGTGVYSAAQTVSMLCADPGAVIRYTTDNTEPAATTGTVYSGPITVNGNTTIKAKAFMAGLADSATNTSVYTFKTAPVVFAPTNLARHYSTYVSMSCPVPGSVIHYTTNGSTPTTSSPVYSAPIFTASNTTFKAIAVASGFANSDPTSASYTFSSAGAEWHVTGDWQGVGKWFGQDIPQSAPVLPSTGIGPDNAWAYGWDMTPGPGPFAFRPWHQFGSTWTQFQGYNDAAFAAPAAAGIARTPYDKPPYYNTSGALYMHTNWGSDGGQPWLLQWTAPASMTISMTGSAHVGEVYVEPDLRPHRIGIRKNGEEDAWSETSEHLFDVRTFNISSMNVNRGDKVYMYFQPLATQGFCTCENWDIFPVSGERTASPAFSAPAGSHIGPLSIALSCADPSATIYYTTNGSAPTTGSMVYSAPIPITGSVTIRAIAKLAALPLSVESSAAYSVVSGTSIRDTKNAANGQSVACGGVIVTNVIDTTTFYVQEIDMPLGIQVRSSATVSPGQAVDVIGTISTDVTTNERFIGASSVTPSAATGIVEPLALTNKALGGSALGLQVGISGAADLNNIGLLVKATGRVTPVSDTEFKIDDGSGPVTVRVASGAPTTAAYVAVTGISSCEIVGGQTTRLIRVGTGGSVQEVQAAP